MPTMITDPVTSRVHLSDIIGTKSLKKYVVLAKEKDDPPWQLAIAAANSVVVMSVRVTPSLHEDVRKDYQVERGHVGIVFDTDGEKSTTLTRKEASRFRTVIKAIKDA